MSALFRDGKLYDACPNCGKIVRLNKPFFGSAHVCTLPEERQAYAAEIRQRYRQAESALEAAKKEQRK
jgi:hypothetical protein